MLDPDYFSQAKRPRLFRFNLIIFPRFQLILVGANLSIMLLVSGITWIQMSRALSELRAVGGLAGVDAEYYRKFLEYNASNLQWSLFIALAVGVVVSTGLTLLISHRFSGPLVRLRGYFTSISKGATPIPRLKFRRGDFMGDLPPIVNQAMDRIEREASTRKKLAS